VFFTFKTHSTLHHSYSYCDRSAKNHEQYVIKNVEASLVQTPAITKGVP
jgi:hypothetical protein